MARNGGQHKASLTRLQPNDGPWTLDWSKVDRDPPFAWPDEGDPAYGELAVFLARHNEMSLPEVLNLTRTNGRSAHHAVSFDELTIDGQSRFNVYFAQRNLDQTAFADALLLSMSYCLVAGDPRRVICLFDGVDRRMMPLWWDPEHRAVGHQPRTHRRRATGRMPCPPGCRHP